MPLYPSCPCPFNPSLYPSNTISENSSTDFAALTRRPAHSWRSASIGSMRAAPRAGT
jgi:hypothetical protein